MLRAGRQPDLVLGDFDSLDGSIRSQLERAGVPMRRAPSDKDESDMELALLAAVESGAARVHILGAFGPLRPEHTVANLWLLADPRFDDLDTEILTGGSRITRIGTAHGPGRGSLHGERGDYVSLFPLGDLVTGVRTTGLRFALDDESLPMGPARGLSNELIGSAASVETRSGRLLVVCTPRDIEQTKEDLA
jgi:thiamine pyrophosphokinase